MSDGELVDPVTALATFNQCGQVTRKNHSHPAAYALLHVASEQMYVGSTEDLYTRVNQHRTRLLAGEHKNQNLQEAFNQDSRFALAFVRTETKEQATEIEQKMLDIHMPSGRLLNISPDAQVANKGVLLSDEKKDQIRQRTIEQFSSKEARDKQSQISKQLWNDPEYREKHKAGMSIVDSEQRSNRITEAIKDKWQDPEYRSKMEADRLKRRKPITIDSVQYSCIKEASEITKISQKTIEYRLYSTLPKHSNFSHVSEEE